MSNPRYTNQIISDLQTPTIEPGDEKPMHFDLHNPYENISMNDLVLNVSIYRYTELEKEKSIEDIENPPVFNNEDVKKSYSIEELTEGEKESFELYVYTDQKTKEGVYSVRFELVFHHEEEKEVMRSRGFFTREEWELAKESVEEVNVSGILTETTFAVEDQISRWPQYTLGFFSILFGILAVTFYMQEKYNSFPNLKDSLEKCTSKFEKFRRRFD